jgi:hypothetical protein
MGLGGFLYFGPTPNLKANVRRGAGDSLAGRLAVNPFKNRRILAFAALRRGDDFGMVPPI